MPIVMPADVRVGVERTHADFVDTARAVGTQCANLNACSHTVVQSWFSFLQRWNDWYIHVWNDGLGVWGDDLTAAERYGAELAAHRDALRRLGFVFSGALTRHEDPNVTHAGRFNPATKQYFVYGAVAAGVVVAGWGIWQVIKIRAATNAAGLGTLRAGAFAGARYPVKRRNSRSARPARQMRGNRPVKKSLRGGSGDYNMEVER